MLMYAADLQLGAETQVLERLPNPDSPPPAPPAAAPPHRLPALPLTHASPQAKWVLTCKLPCLIPSGALGAWVVLIKCRRGQCRWFTGDFDRAAHLLLAGTDPFFAKLGHITRAAARVTPPHLARVGAPTAAAAWTRVEQNVWGTAASGDDIVRLGSLAPWALLCTGMLLAGAPVHRIP